mgnify:CR=1 FL=1
MTTQTDTRTGDPHKAYAEACSLLRHYSLASFSVRTASVVQGLVLLGFFITALKDDHSALALAIGLVGLLFTGLLYRFHMGYFGATGYFYELAAKMEAELFEPDFRPVSSYNEKHASIYSSLASRWFTLNAPFTLVGGLFVAALVPAALW